MPNSLARWFESKRLNPLRELSQVEESFDRLLNDLMSIKSRDNGVARQTFSPSCEISEEGNNYILKFDLPGVAKEQVKVEVDENQIAISAERREEKKQESKKKYLSEVYYGSYTRSFAFPGPVDEKQVDAKFENGVLTVTVPKTEAQKSKQVRIQ